MGRSRVCAADAGCWRIRRRYGVVGGCSRWGRWPSCVSAAAVALVRRCVWESKLCGGLCRPKSSALPWAAARVAIFCCFVRTGMLPSGTHRERHASALHRSSVARARQSAVSCFSGGCGWIGVGAVSRVRGRRRLLANSAAVRSRWWVFELGPVAIVCVGGGSGSGAAVCVGKQVVWWVVPAKVFGVAVGRREGRDFLLRCIDQHRKGLSQLSEIPHTPPAPFCSSFTWPVFAHRCRACCGAGACRCRASSPSPPGSSPRRPRRRARAGAAAPRPRA